jgi:hypothetical protein
MHRAILYKENAIRQWEIAILQTEGAILQMHRPILQTEDAIRQWEIAVLQTEDAVLQMQRPILQRGTVGVLGVHPADPRLLVAPGRLHLLEAFADQIALAVE